MRSISTNDTIPESFSSLAILDGSLCVSVHDVARQEKNTRKLQKLRNDYTVISMFLHSKIRRKGNVVSNSSLFVAPDDD